MDLSSAWGSDEKGLGMGLYQRTQSSKYWHGVSEASPLTECMPYHCCIDKGIVKVRVRLQQLTPQKGSVAHVLEQRNLNWVLWVVGQDECAHRCHDCNANFCHAAGYNLSRSAAAILLRIAWR